MIPWWEGYKLWLLILENFHNFLFFWVYFNNSTFRKYFLSLIMSFLGVILLSNPLPHSDFIALLAVKGLNRKVYFSLKILFHLIMFVFLISSFTNNILSYLFLLVERTVENLDLTIIMLFSLIPSYFVKLVAQAVIRLHRFP